MRASVGAYANVGDPREGKRRLGHVFQRRTRCRIGLLFRDTALVARFGVPPTRLEDWVRENAKRLVA